MRAYIAPPNLGPRPDPPVTVSFSIVLAAYNAGATVGESIDSVLAQTYAPHEILVCDDGSTDDTPSVLARYGSRVTVIRQENAGFAAARNTLLERASGDYVVFLDADDTFLPERLEAFAELARARPDLDVLSTDGYVERDGRVVGRINDITPFPSENQLAELFWRCYLAFPAVRRELVERVGLFDPSLRIAADWDYWLRLLLAGGRAGLVDEPLLNYRLVTGSLSDNRPASLGERVRLLEKARSAPLPARERGILEAALRAHRRRAFAAAANATVLEADGGARLRLLGLIFGSDADVRARAAALRLLVKRRETVRQEARRRTGELARKLG